MTKVFGVQEIELEIYTRTEENTQDTISVNPVPFREHILAQEGEEEDWENKLTKLQVKTYELIGTAKVLSNRTKEVS